MYLPTIIKWSLDLNSIISACDIHLLQILLTEIGSRFVTLPEERLLAVVNALLHRCYKYPTATTAEVPQSLKKELSGVCRACFSADAVNKHVEFVREYKQEFERDLDPESTTTFPATLSELTERLKHWKNVLQSNVEDRFPAVLKLEEESRVLRDFHVVDVEVPGQYFTDQVDCSSCVFSDWLMIKFIHFKKNSIVHYKIY